MLPLIATNLLSFLGSFVLLFNFRFHPFVFRYHYYPLLLAPILAACLQTNISILIYYSLFGLSLLYILSINSYRVCDNTCLKIFSIYISFQAAYSLLLSLLSDVSFSFPDLFRYGLILSYLHVCNYVQIHRIKYLKSFLLLFIPLLLVPLLLSSIYSALGTDMQALRNSGYLVDSTFLDGQRESLSSRFTNIGIILQFTYTNIGLLAGLSLTSAVLFFRQNIFAITLTFIANLVALVLYADKSSAIALSICFLVYLFSTFFRKKFGRLSLLSWFQIKAFTVLLITTVTVLTLLSLITSMASTFYLGDITLSVRSQLLDRFLYVFLQSPDSTFVQIFHILFGHGLFLIKSTLPSYQFIVESQGAIDPYWLDIIFSSGVFGLISVYFFFLQPFLLSLKYTHGTSSRLSSALFLIFFTASLCTRQLGNSSIMMLILSFSLFFQSHLLTSSTKINYSHISPRSSYS